MDRRFLDHPVPFRNELEAETPVQAMGGVHPGAAVDEHRRTPGGRSVREASAHEGLADTPRRVAKAYEELFSGYRHNAGEHLSRVFRQVSGYEDLVLVRDISFVSHCEHHMAPFFGKAHVAYIPNGSVVGISKLARVLHGYARRLQIQERLTAEVAQCVWENLNPLGVAVVIKAQHGCMTGRGVRTHGVDMVTSKVLGCFRDDPSSRKEVLALMGHG